MRETSKVDNLKYKAKAHARVCEENKLEEKTSIEIILRLKMRVEGSYRKSWEEYQDNILQDDSQQHEGISNILS